MTAGRWKTLTQVWHERGSGEARSDKVETAIVYDLGDLDFSLAWREGISGRFEEPGIVFAISREF